MEQDRLTVRDGLGCLLILLIFGLICGPVFYMGWKSEWELSEEKWTAIREIKRQCPNVYLTHIGFLSPSDTDIFLGQEVNDTHTRIVEVVYFRTTGLVSLRDCLMSRRDMALKYSSLRKYLDGRYDVRSMGAAETLKK